MSSERREPTLRKVHIHVQTGTCTMYERPLPHWPGAALECTWPGAALECTCFVHVHD